MTDTTTSAIERIHSIGMSRNMRDLGRELFDEPLSSLMSEERRLLVEINNGEDIYVGRPLLPLGSSLAEEDKRKEYYGFSLPVLASFVKELDDMKSEGTVISNREAERNMGLAQDLIFIFKVIPSDTGRQYLLDIWHVFGSIKMSMVVDEMISTSDRESGTKFIRLPLSLMRALSDFSNNADEEEIKNILELNPSIIVSLFRQDEDDDDTEDAVQQSN